MIALLVGLGGYGICCALASHFSGSVMAPITSVPVAIVTGLLVGWLLIRESDR